MSNKTPAALDLAVVMPVYNEEACIVDVVKSWSAVLSGLNIAYQILVLNDGSRDGTKDVLATFADDERVEVINKANSGHGPTILMGYHKAVDLASWVFQCDSDDEMKAEHFPQFWTKRQDYGALFGIRAGRQQNIGRKLISGTSCLTVRLLFGKGVEDVNVPYRLIRSDLLRQIIAQIPDDTFAPNVLISGALARAGIPLYNHPVPHEGRKTGAASLMKWKLWKAALRSFGQTLRSRPKIKGDSAPAAARQAEPLP